MATIDKINLDRVRLGVQDAAYLAVGVGVIGFNQARTRRREAQAQIGRLGGEVRERVEPVVTRLADNVRPTVGQAREASSRPCRASSRPAPPRRVPASAVTRLPPPPDRRLRSAPC